MEPHPVGDQGRTPVTRRRLLRAWVKLGLLVCVAGFAGVFAYGLFTPATLSAGDIIDVGGLPPGTARLEAWNGGPVWVVHRSGSQQRALVGLSDHVLEPGAGQHPRIDVPHRSVARAYGVYLAATNRAGILVQYVSERPDGLSSDVPWHGGFVDPGGDAVFDVAGRRYRSTHGAALPVPPHRYTADGTIRLGEW